MRQRTVESKEQQDEKASEEAHWEMMGTDTRIQKRKNKEEKKLEGQMEIHRKMGTENERHKN